MSTTSGATPLSKWKHVAIIAGLAAASAGVAQALALGLIDTTLASAFGAVIGEALTYEHSA